VDGRRVVLKATRFPQMKNGETLSTAGRGRAELLLAPGVVLRLAENSQVRMEDTQLSDTRVAIERGDALIEVLQLPEGSRIQVGLADTITEFTRPGLYRFGTMQRTLRVYAGEALVRAGSSMTTPLRRGMAVSLDPTLAVEKFDRKQTDSLHAWSARRSFELFMSDPEARQKQNHWQSAGTGYIENKNFGVEYRVFVRRRPPPPALVPQVPRAESR
jgi:ferric-dicitrate binding protein FerR (iron transport regulator)